MINQLATRVSTFFADLINTGVEGVASEKQYRQVRLINKLSLFIFLMIISIGGIFYFLTFNLSILIPASIESVISVCPILLNRNHKYLAAAMTTFLLQCVATLYFGMLLTKVLELQTVIFFLLLMSFILFNQPRSRRICCVVALVILAALEANSYVTIIPPLHLNTPYSIIFKSLSFAGLFILIIVVGYPYVISHDVNFDLKTSLRNEANTSNAKSIFIRHLSHEIQSNFTGIVKLANSLKAVAAANTPTQELATDMITACISYKQMLSNLLEFTKIDAGAYDEVNPEPINIRELFQKLVKIHHTYAQVEDKRVAINLTIPDDFPRYIIGDELRLTQIVNNLLSNSIKFTRPNSNVYIDLYTQDSTWGFSVKDSGDGISVEKLNSIFDPYVTDRNAKNNPEGIGLGLYITRYIVHDLLEGSIRAYNSPAMGAVFMVSLPLLVCKWQEVTPSSG